MNDFDLGPLADPAEPMQPVDVSALTADDATRILASMTLVRRSEELVGELARSGEAKCPVHLAIGQEACAVGTAEALTEGDVALGAHRSHGHYLGMGGSPEELLAEVLGKAAGCSGGFGGSMHLRAPEQGLLGTVPIVGATIPIAVGAAWAAQRTGTGGVGVSFFGDGAAEEGVFHESCNLAQALGAPVVFVCENNQFSSHLAISLRQPHDSVARYGPVHGLAVRTVDGNDVVAVAAAMGELVEGARNGQPGLLEAVTFRWRGHVGPRDDIDVGVGRSLVELEQWKARDPIARFHNAAVDAGLLTASAVDQIERDIASRLDAGLEAARSAPFPDLDTMYDIVYSDRPAS